MAEDAAERLGVLSRWLHDTRIGFFHLAGHRDFSEVTEPREAFAAWRAGDVEAVRDMLRNGALGETSKRFQSLVKQKVAAGVPFVRVQTLDPALLDDGRCYAAYLAFFLSNVNVRNGEKVYYLHPASIENMPSLDVGIYNGEVVVLTDYERLGFDGQLTGHVRSRTFVSDPEAVAQLIDRYYTPLERSFPSLPPLPAEASDIVSTLRSSLDLARKAVSIR